MVIFAVMVVWSFTFGIWLVSGGGSLLRVIKEPAMAATLLGRAVSVAGLANAALVDQFAGSDRANGDSADADHAWALPLHGLASGNLGRRVLACPLVGRWFALRWPSQPVGPLACSRWRLPFLVLQITTPVAVTSYLLAEKYGADADAVAGLVIVSTVMSIVTLPLTLGFLI